jgi:glycogen debranching enzyme
MLDYGRDLCSASSFATDREWLVTNGLGGYAMGTVGGVLSRGYHGLLIAAMAPPGRPGRPPAARTLLLAKLDETATYDGLRYPLFANRHADEPKAADPWITPKGFRHLERFHLEGTTPVWTFAFADARLEKRVWMQQGANTTYVGYTQTAGSQPIRLNLAALVSYRDHHANVAGDGRFSMQVEPIPDGVRLAAFDDSPPLRLLSREFVAQPAHPPAWVDGFSLAVEAYRGQQDLECYLHAADFEVVLHPGRPATLVASVDSSPHLDSAAALAARRLHEQDLLDRARDTRHSQPNAKSAPPAATTPDWLAQAIDHLVLAADQFVVERQQPDGAPGRSVIAGYPWFGDWGRDTMISLSGLTLVTGRPEIARQILLTFAAFVDRGMLPNRFPDAGEEPEYNTVDATLWYVEAIRAYHEATGDDHLLAELYPVLQDIVDWHRRGTRYAIHLDETDGLLYGGSPEVQLTWMDAKLDDWVVTPRIGKPVEINALWYNALCSLAGFARRLGHTVDAEGYAVMAEQTRQGFRRFWNPAVGYCFDVLDGPAGDDASLRPNQLFAVSLHHSPLDATQAQAVVDVCARQLLTSHGLRSLAPDHPDYIGRYGGDRRTRDAAYHQGTVWGWLLGPFASAHLRVHGDPAQARALLTPMLQHLNGHCIGSLSEIFDGDPPFTPRGCIAQAWTVAEVLRAWAEVEGGGWRVRRKHVSAIPAHL